MLADNNSQFEGSAIYDQLADTAESRRGELLKIYQQSLRKNVYSNRFEFHPRKIANISGQITDALISFLRNPSTGVQEHGGFLCDEGLSVTSVLGLCRDHRRVFSSLFAPQPEDVEISGDFIRGLVEGFFGRREKLILTEQESFRVSFQIALNRSSKEILKARSEAQKATESSFRKIIMAQEEERRRISRELHDGAGQSLIGIHYGLENILKEIPQENRNIRERLEKAIGSLEGAMQEIKALAYSLRPPVLDLLGIHLTIKQLCLDFSDQSNLKIFYSGMDFPRVADELAISIYRVVQEALTNIVKHSHADHAWVKLGYLQDSIELVITDDGQGFDPQQAKSGLGLLGMQERIQLLNGRMEILSSEGRYSRLEIYLPLILKSTTSELES